MTGRPVLAFPAKRRRHTAEVALEASPVAMGTAVVLGWDHRNRAVILTLAEAQPEWIDDLVHALWEARRAATQEVRP